MKDRRLLLSCLLLLAVPPDMGGRVSAAGQDAGGSGGSPLAVAGQSAVFRHITIEQGLSGQRVEAIVQDSAGFMWFGTNTGLNRYDGHTIVAYRHDPDNPHSIAGNLVSALHEDRFGILWVATRSGLSAFDRRTGRFTNYRHDPANPRSLSDNSVIALSEDRSGALWVATASGLDRFDRAAGTFTTFRHDPGNPRSLSDDSVRVIVEDRAGALWVGTLGGLNRLDPATGLFTVFRHDPGDPRSLRHNGVWDILEDRQGTLWVGTDGGGLSRFDPASGSFVHYRHDPADATSLSDDRVDCLFEDDSGALWIGTFGGGLSVLDAARERFQTYRRDPLFPASLGHDYVAEIAADRSGLIWIGTHGSGVDVHDSRRGAFTVYQHDPRNPASLASSNVSAVSEDRDGVLWIGTQDRGLDRLDRRRGEAVHYPPDPGNPRGLGHPWVSALEPDAAGALWVGTYGGGLYRLDPASGRFTAYRHDPRSPRSLSDDAVADLHIDRSGVLWVGTRSGGLNRFDAATGTFTSYRHDPDDPRTLGGDGVWTIAADPDGSLWIGSLVSGLSRLVPGTGAVTRYQHDPGDPATLSDNSVWALHVDRSGELWVGTRGGLNRFERGRGVFTRYRERDGLASDRVVSIQEEGGPDAPSPGTLWIATGRGLSRLDRDRKTFRTYDTTQGLLPAEYSRGGETTRRGELLIGSSQGLIAFDPRALRDEQDAPPLVFTNFLLANKPAPIGDDAPLREAIDQAGSIALTHADRVISFEFAALNYRGAQLTRYRYRLDGFDNDWTEVGSTQRLVTYTNLAPGQYVFRVTAANADGVWNEAGRAIALVITPPWWATWWFRVVTLTLVVGFSTGVYIRRVSSLERRRVALEEEINERRKVEDTLRANNRRIQDLAGRLITAQEVERSRIARDLHDDVNQQLVALSLSLSSLNRFLPADVPAQQELASLQSQALAVSETIRQVSHELHPELLHHAGLAAALRGRCEEFGGLHAIEVAFHGGDGLDQIPRDVALCLFRVAQEALHNTARHAAARHVDVSLTRTDSILELKIADDGRGFDQVEGRERRGLGLISIDERVRLVEGQLQIHSERGRGTVVEVRVPLRLRDETAREDEDDARESTARRRSRTDRAEPGPIPAG